MIAVCIVLAAVAGSVFFAYKAGKKSEELINTKKLISQKEAHQSALNRWIEENDKIIEENKVLRKKLHLSNNVVDINGVFKEARISPSTNKAGTAN